MFKRVLGTALTAGTVLAGVHAVSAAEFVFRYRGMGPTQVAAVTPPEEPEAPAFDVNALSFGPTKTASFIDTDHNHQISAGDYFYGTVEIVNPGAAGTIEVQTAGHPSAYGHDGDTVTCNLKAQGLTKCEQWVEFTTDSIYQFCGNSPIHGMPYTYTPMATAPFGSTPLTANPITVVDASDAECSGVTG